MRMKMVCDDRTLAEVANEFLALKKAQKVRERTLNDYKKYIDKFLRQIRIVLSVGILFLRFQNQLSPEESRTAVIPELCAPTII